MIRTLAFVVLTLSTTTAFAQTASVFVATWRGCEEACQGFKDYVEGLDKDVALTIRDAGQDRAALDAIRSEATSGDYDLVVTWGTSVTRALAGTIKELDDPTFNHETAQVFMIVADPVGSEIVVSLEETGRPNLTGTYNRMPETVTIATARRLLPGFQRLGLLYNENEPNSVTKREELAALEAQAGFELIALPFDLDAQGLPKAEDIGPRVRALKKAGAEVLYIGSSSFLRANGAVLGAAAADAGLPVISPYEDLVRDGQALISVAARYYDVGQLAGRQAEAILFEGRSPGTLPVLRMTEFAVMLNLSVAKDINLWPPMDLLQIAEVIE